MISFVSEHDLFAKCAWIYHRGRPVFHFPGYALGKRELAFLGDTFECFGRALDPVLAVVAIGRKQADHFIGPTRGRPRDIAGGKIDSLSNVIFMFQRPLHHAKRRPAYGPARVGRLKNRGSIARAKTSWPAPSPYHKEDIF